jgi:hypothetical protein
MKLEIFVIEARWMCRFRSAGRHYSSDSVSDHRILKLFLDGLAAGAYKPPPASQKGAQDAEHMKQ